MQKHTPFGPNVHGVPAAEGCEDPSLINYCSLSFFHVFCMLEIVILQVWVQQKFASLIFVRLFEDGLYALCLCDMIVE